MTLFTPKPPDSTPSTPAEPSTPPSPAQSDSPPPVPEITLSSLIRQKKNSRRKSRRSSKPPSTQTEAAVSLDRAKKIMTPGCLAVTAGRGKWFFAAHLKKLDEAVHKFILDNDRGTAFARIMVIDSPPRHGKSLYCSCYLPAWFRGRFPDKHCFITSYESTFAAEWGAAARDVFSKPATADENGETIGDLFGVAIDPNVKHATRWKFAGHEGVTRTAGARGPLTGRGAHLLVIDDPYKNDIEAHSPKIRQATWDWFLSTAMTRVEPGGCIILIACMTGDTPVLLSEGAEKLLRDIRVGDCVASYKDGNLVPARVLNWVNHGPDRVFTIRMTSGTTVRANERHPFLTYQEGKLVWKTLRHLKPGDRILRAIAACGKGSSVDIQSATSQPSAEGSACHTTTRSSGQPATGRNHGIQSLTEEHICGIATALTSKTTTPCFVTRSESVPFVEGLHLLQTCEQEAKTVSEENPSLLTTTQRPERSVGSCATTVILPSGTEKQRKSCFAPLSTYTIVPDEIAEITFSGMEDVFDIQVEGSENFVANGLISHNTRWHREDISGRVLDLSAKGEFEPVLHVHLPAISEPDDPIPDSLQRPPGTALWPERFPIQDLARIRHSQSTYWWSALYQGKPTASGVVDWPDSYFESHIWCDEQHWPSDFSLRVVFVDPAIKKSNKPGDPAAIVFVGVKGNLVYIDAVAERMSSGALINRTLSFLDKYQPDLVGWEANSFQQVLGEQLQRDTNKHFGVAYPIFMVTNTVPKVLRIRRLDTYWRHQEFRLRMTPGCRALVEQARDFPLGEHDDILDALENAVRLPIEAQFIKTR
jgi:predicted phage terminase large subunit-like protein